MYGLSQSTLALADDRLSRQMMRDPQVPVNSTHVKDVLDDLCDTDPVAKVLLRMYMYDPSYPRCLYPSPAGRWVCTRTKGHDGVHVAHGNAASHITILEYWHDSK